MTKCFRRAWKCTPLHGAGMALDIDSYASDSSNSVSEEAAELYSAEPSSTSKPEPSDDPSLLSDEDDLDVRPGGTLSEEVEANDLEGCLWKLIEEDLESFRERLSGLGGVGISSSLRLSAGVMGLTSSSSPFSGSSTIGKDRPRAEKEFLVGSLASSPIM